MPRWILWSVVRFKINLPCRPLLPVILFRMCPSPVALLPFAPVQKIVCFLPVLNTRLTQSPVCHASALDPRFSFTLAHPPPVLNTSHSSPYHFSPPQFHLASAGMRQSSWKQLQKTDQVLIFGRLSLPAPTSWPPAVTRSCHHSGRPKLMHTMFHYVPPICAPTLRILALPFLCSHASLTCQPKTTHTMLYSVPPIYAPTPPIHTMCHPVPPLCAPTPRPLTLHVLRSRTREACPPKLRS